MKNSATSSASKKRSVHTGEASPSQTSTTGNVWKTRQESQQAKKNAGIMHDRLMYLLTNLVGLSVRVTVKSGTVYEGIFHGANTEGNLGVSLKMACVVDSTTGKAKINLQTVIPQLVIEPQDFQSIEALDIDVLFADRGNLSEAQGFQTDTGISGHLGEVSERKLEKWVPDENVPISSLQDQEMAAWDQFEANEKLFGVKTDYNEELYTTKLDKESAEYKQKEREAQKLAEMIEKSTADNVHVAEERGLLAIDDSQMDEEDRYGAVVRSPNAYAPPQLRKQQQNSPKKSPPKSSQNSSPKLPEKSPKLNPNAQSFKFNLKAAEFKPSFGNLPSLATTKVKENVFGKRIAEEKLEIRQVLFKNFHPDSQIKSWPKGTQNVSELAEKSATVFTAAAMPYGYPAPPVTGFPVVQQQFMPPPQFQQVPYGTNAFIPAPMQYGYQPIVYIPQYTQQRPSMNNNKK